MPTPLENLIALLNIERLERDLFRGIGSGGENTKRIFGGHVIAQALAAAYNTVEGRLCHSLHAYFIRPGDPSVPVIYEVDRARDGGSFTTRRVVAIQHGQQIFNLAASFHADEEGWRHQHDMPDAPAPTSLPSRADYRDATVSKMPEKLRAEYTRPRAVEVRELNPMDYFEPAPLPDRNALWFRADGPVDENPMLNHCLIAYASDMNLLGSGIRPHGVSWFKGEVIGASLDHAMWFHAPIRFENWHLYALDSPFGGNGRSFNRGQIFTQDGVLVASVAQEGLMRKPRPKTG